jgi:hypothetical protein
MWKHRMEQQKLMKSPRPTTLLEAILYDMSAFERKRRASSSQVLHRLTDRTDPVDEPLTNLVYILPRGGAR